MDVRALVEAELSRRGMAFARDVWSRRLVLDTAAGVFLLSMDNLERAYALDPRPRTVSDFLDLALTVPAEISVAGLAWMLDSNNYGVRAGFTVPVTPRLDRILVHVASDGTRLTWLTQADLEQLGMDLTAASEHAYRNLDNELDKSELTVEVAHGVQLLYLNTQFPAKASLLLAPALRESVSALIGWPVLAVAPDRDFVLIWNAQDQKFIEHAGALTMREYGRAPYPLSLEVFHIADEFRAIGEFAKKEH